MNIKPNHPKSFFKYVSASTAEIILSTRTLRWSHPDEFDDTLDVAQVCDAKMDKIKQKQIQDAILDLAANPPVNINANNANETFKALAQLLQSSRNKTSTILEAKKHLVIDISEAVADLNEQWKEIRNNFRILCLGVEKDNHRLWNDYAETYKGAVIEFACREESDSPWLIANPVEYVSEKDLFLTVEEWAEAMSLETIAMAHYIMEKCSIKKAKDNKHKWFEQNEWRIPSFRRHHEIGMVSHYGVNPNDFVAIYFGHKMSVETQNNILSLLYGELSHVSAFRCKLESPHKMTFSKL